MKNVLVVESDQGLSWLICESLRDAGYEPVPCAPEAAVALAAERPASAIIAALSSAAVEQAPLYKALRREPRTKDIPIIIITGRGDATIRRRLGEKPPTVLFKPLVLAALMEAVAQAVGGA